MACKVFTQKGGGQVVSRFEDPIISHLLYLACSIKLPVEAGPPGNEEDVSVTRGEKDWANNVNLTFDATPYNVWLALCEISDMKKGILHTCCMYAHWSSDKPGTYQDSK